MHTVIKSTQTFDEYKRLRALMEQKAQEAYSHHKQAFEAWQEGDIDKVWIDADGNLCIQYQSGRWWHYNDLGEWW